MRFKVDKRRDVSYCSSTAIMAPPCLSKFLQEKMLNLLFLVGVLPAYVQASKYVTINTSAVRGDMHN